MADVRREIGDVIGGYTVLATLGRGGSGAVYQVRDEGGDVAALKLVDAASDPVAAQRLAREVHALQSLRHEAVPRILDAELDGDDTFVVFEYIPGDSLWQYVQDHGALVGEELANLAERIASALEAAHAAGVVHRDVTPSNVMMGPRGPVLIDFGLAHRTYDERLTRDGLVSGTAGYVAPEVIDGAEPGPIADRWSWASTVAYAMTGTAPFGSGTGAISRTLEARVELPDVPGADALGAALSREISARPGMRDVVAALRGATEVLGAAPDPTLVAAGTAVMPQGMLPDGVGEPEAWAGEDAHTDEGVAHDGQSDDDWADEEWTEEDWEDDPDALPPPREGRNLMVLSWHLAVAGAAALAPVVALVAMTLGAIVSRAVHRRAAALAASRARRGERRGDAVVQTIGMPWHLLRGAAEALPAVIVAAVLGVGVGALVWWMVSVGLLVPETPAGLAWGRAGALVLAGLVTAAGMWWGPFAEATRDGARRFALGLAPTKGVAAAWVIVAVTIIGVVVVAVWAQVDPRWWPLPESVIE
ncbi:serine/threonine-protein kinase [Demequina sp. NBRC 110052]|uniref:serine/threonine-protein kinase n=1 Tax=Demequina sp. NBRC 110052 TaxID=1570341 RepID=UPI000A025254|nr:serine/threonine-protein kinase [Demequina sp. NBRC 110052]